jgi:CRP-like cAMP-binding protein
VLSVVQKVMLLSEVDIFSEVPTEELAFLARVVEEQRYASGETIYGELDLSDAMYLVVEGTACLGKDGREVALVEPGQTFGTWALFDDEPRVLSATARSDVLVLRLDQGDFIELIADNVLITRGVLKALAVRLRKLLSRFGGAEGGPHRRAMAGLDGGPPRGEP